MGNETMTLEKLGQGLNKINEQLDEHSKQFEKIDKRFEAMDKRFDRMENRFEKRFDTLATSVSSLEFDMRDVKSELKVMDAKYDKAFGHLDAFLGRLTDQEEETTFIKNDQNVIKNALRVRLGLDADSPEFR
jgi:chromosome segregation ATPase